MSNPRDSSPASCRGRGVAVVVAALLTTPTVVCGESYDVVLSGSVGVEYDDNVGLQTADEVDSVATRIGLRVGVESTGARSEVNAGVQVTHVEYDEAGLDDEDLLLLELHSRYRRSERNTLFLDGTYKLDSTLRTDRVLDEDDVDIGLAERKVDRHRAMLNPGITYAFSERSEGTLAYKGINVDFDGGSAVGLEDYVQHEVVGEWGYLPSERSRHAIRATARLYEAPDRDSTFESLIADYVMAYDVSEVTNATFAVGAHWTDFDLNGTEGDDQGFLASLGFTRRTELGHWEGSVERVLNPSGRGELVETDQILLGVEQALSERSRVDLRVRYFRNKPIDGTGSVEREYFFIEPAYRYYFTPSWRLDAAYRYRWKDAEGSPQAESNAAFISVTYAPLSESRAARQGDFSDRGGVQ